MGFNYLGVGSYLECACDGSNILVYRNTGEVRKYKTNLQVAIPRQRRIFEGYNVYFYLEHDGVCYVGRADGSLTGYRLRDDLLVRITSWEAPEAPRLEDIGSYYDVKARRAMLDTSDRRTIYVAESTNEYILKQPFNRVVNVPAAIGAAVAREPGLHICTVTEKEVDLQNDGRWFIQDSTGSGDKKKLI